jgi:hypothetical protein
VQEACWVPDPFWAGAGYLVSTGIRSPDHSTRKKSLYRRVFLADINDGNIAFRNSCVEIRHVGVSCVSRVGL